MFAEAKARLGPLFERRILDVLHRSGGVTFAVELPNGRRARVGPGAPAFVLRARDEAGLRALRSLDRTRLAESYLRGELDVEGDLLQVLSMRDAFPERRAVSLLRRTLRPLLFGQVASDRRWIAQHYDEDPEFYLHFLDRRHRCYSQAIFAGEEEPLEDAVTRKLDFALDAAGIRPGDRVLDIGGGWGAFTEYAGRRGVRVTSLTISRASESYLEALIERESLPCRVVNEHLLAHTTAEPYDAIVNLGVTEHLPDYPATLRKYAELLRAGGRVYIDASAAREKGDLSKFFLRHIFPGNGSPLCLGDYVAALQQSAFELLAVHNDRENYRLTSLRWAENLDAARSAIEARWGRAQYRRFQLYLWGCVDGFARDTLQAYRLVFALPA
jgi:cyclopropane-fatty-acyl-phospholipid synthase